MYYSVRHITKFRYNRPVYECVMELRMQPRSDEIQRCFKFDVRTSPKAQITAFTDHLDNGVHYFDVPDRHTHLTIRAQSQVDILSPPGLPEALPDSAWEEVDAVNATDEYWDSLVPSKYTNPNEQLRDLARELTIVRGRDPLSTLRYVNTAIHDSFEYDTGSTDADSPIDHALASRRGVCQDFAHIMIALVRQLNIPCRYVSGYLYQSGDVHDRSPADATHAWVESLLPGLGWVGFDPTNNLIAGDRHIRVAVGRDYADVPPTRGVFKGRAETELAVSVRVSPTGAPQTEEIEEESEPIYRPTQELGAGQEDYVQEQPQQ